MAWSGFSEDAIRHMKEENDQLSVNNTSNSRELLEPKRVQVVKVNGKRGRPTSSRGRCRKTTPIHRSKNGSNAPALHPNQRLSAETIKEEEAGMDLKEVVPAGKQMKLKEKEHSGTDDTNTKTETPQELEAPKCPEPRKILDDVEGKRREITKLQDLQEKQEQIERENKIKKDFLFKAIENRKKKTQQEAKRIAFIQKELSKIENLLTSDISILRDKIEESSRTFVMAEKRYQYAEKEFVEAKIYLHKMEERKNALTEHLFVIIHENELRKAKKLEELVSTLNTEDLDKFKKEIEQSETQSVVKPAENEVGEKSSHLQQTFDMTDLQIDANNVENQSPVLNDIVPDTVKTGTELSGEVDHSVTVTDTSKHEIPINGEIKTIDNLATTDDKAPTNIQLQS